MPLCVTCGTQTSYKGADLDLSSQDTEYKCPICLDPRQFIGSLGQRWTTLQDLLQNKSLSPSPNVFTSIIPDSLWTFQTLPKVGIGQRAFLIKDSQIQGLIMWDCIAYLDDETLNWIDEFSKGQGVSHMIVSHPHYYTTTATWTAAFPKMKLWLAKEDFNDWYQRIDIKEQLQKGDFESESVASRIHLVDEEQTSIDPHGHVKILLLGGHFPGSLVLLWNEILFIADTIQVVPSALYKSEQKQRPGVASVTFLWRYVIPCEKQNKSSIRTKHLSLAIPIRFHSVAPRSPGYVLLWKRCRLVWLLELSLDSIYWVTQRRRFSKVVTYFCAGWLPNDWNGKSCKKCGKFVDMEYNIMLLDKNFFDSCRICTVRFSQSSFGCATIISSVCYTTRIRRNGILGFCLFFYLASLICNRIQQDGSHTWCPISPSSTY